MNGWDRKRGVVKSKEGQKRMAGGGVRFRKENGMEASTKKGRVRWGKCHRWDEGRRGRKGGVGVR